MISENTMRAIQPLVKELNERGVCVRPIQNTILAQLCNESARNLVAANIANVELPSVESAILEATVSDNTLRPSTHDEVMAKGVEFISSTLSNTAALARSGVAPMIREVVEEINKILDRQSVQTISPCVEQIFLEDFFPLALAEELFSVYEKTVLENVSYKGPPLYFSPEQYSSGTGTIDQAIEGMVERLKDTKQDLSVFWQQTFGLGFFKTGEVLSGGYESLPKALLTYFTAMHLVDNPPDNTNVSLDEWRTQCKNVATQAGAKVIYLIRRYQRDFKLGYMVLSYPGEGADKIIQVDGPVYLRFIDLGGTPEILFGALYKDQPKDAPTLLKNKDIYLKQWAVARTMLSNTLAANALADTIKVAREVMTNCINRLEVGGAIVDSSAVLHQRLHEFLSKVHQNDLKDVWSFGRRLVCDVIYPHTDVKQLLMLIDQAAAGNPEGSPREFALSATIELMADWLVSNMTFEAIKV